MSDILDRSFSRSQVWSGGAGAQEGTYSADLNTSLATDAWSEDFVWIQAPNNQGPWNPAGSDNLLWDGQMYKSTIIDADEVDDYFDHQMYIDHFEYSGLTIDDVKAQLHVRPDGTVAVPMKIFDYDQPLDPVDWYADPFVYENMHYNEFGGNNNQVSYQDVWGNVRPSGEYYNSTTGGYTTAYTDNYVTDSYNQYYNQYESESYVGSTPGTYGYHSDKLEDMAFYDYSTSDFVTDTRAITLSDMLYESSQGKLGFVDIGAGGYLPDEWSHNRTGDLTDLWENADPMAQLGAGRYETHLENWFYYDPNTARYHIKYDAADLEEAERDKFNDERLNIIQSLSNYVSQQDIESGSSLTDKSVTLDDLLEMTEIQRAQLDRDLQLGIDQTRTSYFADVQESVSDMIDTMSLGDAESYYDRYWD